MYMVFASYLMQKKKKTDVSEEMPEENTSNRNLFKCMWKGNEAKYNNNDNNK